MTHGAVEQLIADFSLLDEWEDRYRYIIELGRALPDFPEAQRNQENKVVGCTAQVWIASQPIVSDAGLILKFSGDSDAAIVKGLIAIVFAIFSEQSPQTILSTDEKEIFKQLGLEGHLTQQRSNGLAAMVERLKTVARFSLEA